MGNVAFARGEFASARAAHAEALQLVRELGDKRGVAVIVNNLGNADLALGDLANARKHDEESLQLRRELGDKRGVALVLGNLGDIAAAQKDYATAEEYYRQALMGLHEQGERRAILACLIGACEVAGGAGQGTRAVVLAGGIHTGLACLDVDVDRREHQRFEDTLARLRADLDPHAFEQAWNQGTSLTLEQLVDLALAPPASNQVI